MLTLAKTELQQESWNKMLSIMNKHRNWEENPYLVKYIQELCKMSGNYTLDGIVKELHQEGLSIAEISQEVDRSRNFVREKLIELGLREVRPVVRKNEERDKQIIDLYNKGRKNKEICSLLNLKYSIVCSVIHRNKKQINV